MLRRPRPSAGWAAAFNVLAAYLWRGAWVAGVVTAIVVATMRPPVAVWLTLWLVLAVLVAVALMRQSSPKWFAWMIGRDPDPPDSN